jgi:hypothetical protein
MVGGNARSAALGAGMILLSVLPLLWLETRPRDATSVAVIFPPWLSADAAFARVIAAGGVVARPGAWRTILVVKGAAADLPDRLYAMGAWAVVDPQALGGCLGGRP